MSDPQQEDDVEEEYRETVFTVNETITQIDICIPWRGSLGLSFNAGDKILYSQMFFQHTDEDVPEDRIRMSSFNDGSINTYTEYDGFIDEFRHQSYDDGYSSDRSYGDRDQGSYYQDSYHLCRSGEDGIKFTANHTGEYMYRIQIIMESPTGYTRLADALEKARENTTRMCTLRKEIGELERKIRDLKKGTSEEMEPKLNYYRMMYTDGVYIDRRKMAEQRRAQPEMDSEKRKLVDEYTKKMTELQAEFRKRNEEKISVKF